ncbi:ATP-binding protein [Paraburkholderia sp.]|uniref:ATP-binding protein n=1 Tax=Paraburkholderia sp. TaxID=1926495 RepID=UPI002386013F|nr:ATP-binding protein [Paraburkholderia sp.]MDE1179872.1 ATP-binding protein [Paraburkholderia sp.]
MKPESIRHRLMLLIFVSISLVWAIALASSYRQATREVSEWEDARLAELAQILALLDQADLITLANARIDVREEEKGGDPGASPDDDDDTLPRDALFQVRDENDRVLAGSPQLVALNAWDLPLPTESGAQDMTLGGQSWHTFTLRNTALKHDVRVFEPANTRSDLVSGVASRIARPTVIALPILALLVWISIGFSLAPLRTLSNAIRARHIHRLDPIEIERAPTEVRPLVDAINHVLSRLQHSFERERAFTADAAHELRTPLAAIKVQAQVALAETDVSLQRLAMQRVVQGVDRSARLAAQLLLLARLDTHETISAVRLVAASIANDAVAANEHSARQKNMRVAVTGDMHAEIVAEPVLTGILLDNLIDNAIKYGMDGGRIDVAIEHTIEHVLLIVRDDGPGVAAADLTRLTHRFFRATGNDASGSGLGLSIVARIAEHFGAHLSLGVGIDGCGLAVQIAFRHATGLSPTHSVIGTPADA